MDPSSATSPLRPLPSPTTPEASTDQSAPAPVPTLTPTPLPLPPNVAPTTLQAPTSNAGASPDKDKDKDERKTPHRRTRPASSLPIVRLLLSPVPGIGLDVRLPYGRLVRLYVALEAYVTGTSQVRFGAELNRFPFIRVEAAPNPCISVRPSLLRLSDLKFVTPGVNVRFGSSRGVEADAVLEVQHRYTLLGSVIDASQRARIYQMLDDLQLPKAIPENLKETLRDITKNTGTGVDMDALQSESLTKIKSRIQSLVEDIVHSDKVSKDTFGDANGNDIAQTLPKALKQLVSPQEQGDSPSPARVPRDVVEKSAAVHSAQNRADTRVLGQMKVGDDGRYHLVAPEGGETSRSEMEEVDKLVNEVLKENRLVVLGRKLKRKLSKTLRPPNDNQK